MAIYESKLLEDEQSICKVLVEGEVRRGKALETDQQLDKVLQQAALKSKKKLVIFDLKGVTYWDTKGIATILESVIAINKAIPHSAGVVAPVDDVLLLPAKRMFPQFGSELLPVESDDSSLIGVLTK